MSFFGNYRSLSSVRFFRLVGVASFAMFVVGVVLILWQLFPDVMVNTIVPVHYNVHFGVDQVGPWWRLFVPSAFAVAVSVGNTVFAIRAWSREQVIAYAFFVTTLLVNIFVLLYVIFIVLLNISYA